MIVAKRVNSGTPYEAGISHHSNQWVRVRYGPYMEEVNFCGVPFKAYEQTGDLPGNRAAQPSRLSQGGVPGHCGGVVFKSYSKRFYLSYIDKKAIF